MKGISRKFVTNSIEIFVGNLLFENDFCREIVFNYDQGTTFINLLDHRNSDIINFCLKSENDESELLTLSKVRSGVICNFLLGVEEISKKAVELNIIDKIQSIIQMCLETENFAKVERIIADVLPSLNVITEQLSDLYFKPDLNLLILTILKKSSDKDLAETCVELLAYQAENDDIKLLLSREGLCQTIYELVEKYKSLVKENEDLRSLMKMSLDLIVLILTGDAAMNYLYESSNLLKLIENWLNSSDDIDILTTGILALGNFARTDNHCIYLVEQNFMSRLVEILKHNKGADVDMRLQHSLLSTLKNLVIPKVNKSLIEKCNLIETLLEMLTTDNPPVIFKLLGTLRMAIDQQEKIAQNLLANESLIKRLVFWSSRSEYAIQSEASRLLAWIVKNAYQGNKEGNAGPIDVKPLENFVKIDGTVEALIKMLGQSTHLIMQNEALIALSIITISFYQKNQSKDLDEILIKHNLSKMLADFISNSSDTMTKEIAENVQSFIKILNSSEEMRANLKESCNVEELLKGIPSFKNLCTL